MRRFKNFISRLSFFKEDRSVCKCFKPDRCTCYCHNEPGCLHMVNCCSVKKCEKCNKNYNSKFILNKNKI